MSSPTTRRWCTANIFNPAEQGIREHKVDCMVQLLEEQPRKEPDGKIPYGFLANTFGFHFFCGIRQLLLFIFTRNFNSEHECSIIA